MDLEPDSLVNNIQIYYPDDTVLLCIILIQRTPLLRNSWHHIDVNCNLALCYSLCCTHSIFHIDTSISYLISLNAFWTWLTWRSTDSLYQNKYHRISFLQRYLSFFWMLSWTQYSKVSLGQKPSFLYICTVPSTTEPWPWGATIIHINNKNELFQKDYFTAT